MSRIVFIRDKTNKHSIRALLAAYEKWFPNREYYVVTPQDAVTFLSNNDTALFSFLTGSSSAYIEYVTRLKEMLPNINTVCGGAHPSARSNEMLKYLEKTIGNKKSVVILMHDTGSKKGTYEILPKLIKMLKEKGYKFENIYDLLR